MAANICERACSHKAFKASHLFNNARVSVTAYFQLWAELMQHADAVSLDTWQHIFSYGYGDSVLSVTGSSEYCSSADHTVQTVNLLFCRLAYSNSTSGFMAWKG